MKQAHGVGGVRLRLARSRAQHDRRLKSHDTVSHPPANQAAEKSRSHQRSTPAVARCARGGGGSAIPTRGIAGHHRDRVGARAAGSRRDTARARAFDALPPPPSICQRRCQGQGQGDVHLYGYLSAFPRTRTCSASSQFVMKPLPPTSLPHYLPILWTILLPAYPCCLRYAMTLLMSASFWDPPFCAHVALSSAALLPM